MALCGRPASPKPQPLSLSLDEGLAVHLYPDMRPHVGRLARLQKGLVLVIGGQGRIEERFGCGLPLAVVGERVYPFLQRFDLLRLQGDSR
jgi:hypothetical protein